MTQLRTDLPTISDKEMFEWTQDILENTHYRDIKILNHRLDEAIESHEKGLHEPELNI